MKNPVAAAALTEIVQGYLAAPHHSLSITGGEPLLHAAFFEQWLPVVQDSASRCFLRPTECCRTTCAACCRCSTSSPWTSKRPPPPGCRRRTRCAGHREFLAIARATDVYGKLVVTPCTTEQELAAIVDTIAEVDPANPLILQPVTPFGYERQDRCTARRLLRFHALASRRLREVRVIPQTHKMMKMV